MKDKDNNLLYITHSGELLIWLIVVLIIVSFSTIIYMYKEKNDSNDYQIFLQDVDGLIVGSPVRMMGIEVGYVTKIKPANDEVYVKFLLTNPDVYIPQGTRVTVEFSGMAGSKSLELYLPDKNTYIDQSTTILEPTPPKRLHDALGLLNDMLKKIGSIIYTTSSFGGKLDNIELETPKGGDVGEFLKYTNDFLDDSNNKASDLRSNLERLKGNVE